MHLYPFATKDNMTARDAKGFAFLVTLAVTLAKPGSGVVKSERRWDEACARKENAASLRHLLWTGAEFAPEAHEPSAQNRRHTAFQAVRPPKLCRNNAILATFSITFETEC